MNLKKTVIGAACGALMAVGSAANADLITDWDFSVTTVWGDAVFEGDFPGGDSGGTTFESATELSWGATGGSFVGPNPNRSALVISDNPATGSLVTNAGPSATSILTHYNNVLAGGTNSLLSAGITSTLTLTPTAPPGPARPPLVAEINLQFFETPNLSSCGFPSVSFCDDIFVLQAEELSDTFVIDNIAYTTSIVSPLLINLPAATCAEVGAGPGCFGLTTQEGLENPVAFGVRIDARELPVPAPAPVFLLGAGLLGLGFAGARRRK